MTDDQFSSAMSVAMKKVKAAGGIGNVPEPIRVAVTVCTAQGIIDNGGLQYFYEVDFEDQCPYPEFADAYRSIGALDAADLFERSWRLFPFVDAHLYEAKRQQWLDLVKEDEDHEFHVLSDRLIGNKSVFPKLEDYIERHWALFRSS